MKFKTAINLLFILSFFICHVGICSTITDFSKAKELQNHNCHEIELKNNKSKFKKTYQSIKSTNIDENCCLSTIFSTNEIEDKFSPNISLNHKYYIKINSSKVYFTPVLLLNKGHPPPDIILNKSTFLI